MHRGAKLLFSLVVFAVLFGFSFASAFAQEGVLGADEERLVELINQWRSHHGLSLWQVDPLLVDVARERARDVAQQGFAALSSPPLEELLARQGASYAALQESAFMASSIDGAFSALVKYYPAYRQVIESTGYTRVGIGVAQRGKMLCVVQIAASGEKKQANAAVAQPVPLPEPARESQPASGAVVLTQEEQRMVELVNAERARYGLPPLKVKPQLVQLARLKARDMVENNYFGHTSPTYGSPFEMMRRFGVTYSFAGENLAGASTVETAHRALMSSSGHRANILNPNFKEIGVGVVSGSAYGKIFVQLFTG